jgi:hypothetical protein
MRLAATAWRLLVGPAFVHVLVGPAFVYVPHITS